MVGWVRPCGEGAFACIDGLGGPGQVVARSQTLPLTAVGGAQGALHLLELCHSPAQFCAATHLLPTRPAAAAPLLHRALGALHVATAREGAWAVCVETVCLHVARRAAVYAP